MVSQAMTTELEILHIFIACTSLIFTMGVMQTFPYSYVASFFYFLNKPGYQKKMDELINVLLRQYILSVMHQLQKTTTSTETSSAVLTQVYPLNIIYE